MELKATVCQGKFIVNMAEDKPSLCQHIASTARNLNLEFLRSETTSGGNHCQQLGNRAQGAVAFIHPQLLRNGSLASFQHIQGVTVDMHRVLYVNETECMLLATALPKCRYCF